MSNIIRQIKVQGVVYDIFGKVELANLETLGGIKAAPKTEKDTVEVKIGTDGKLYVPQMGGGGGSTISYEIAPDPLVGTWEIDDSRPLFDPGLMSVHFHFIFESYGQEFVSMQYMMLPNSNSWGLFYSKATGEKVLAFQHSGYIWQSLEYKTILIKNVDSIFGTSEYKELRKWLNNNATKKEV